MSSAGLNDTLSSTGRFNVSQSMAQMAKRSGMPAGGLASAAATANEGSAGVNKQVRAPRQRFSAFSLLSVVTPLTGSARGSRLLAAAVCAVGR